MDHDIAVIGLGTMGASLARNIHSRGFKVSVYNRTTEKMEAFIEEFGDEKLKGYESLKELVESLATPRKIILLVPDKAVDAVIGQLTEVLDAGDMIMDGGNTYFKETVRRQEELATKDIKLLGCGISGGEEGALKGPSMMPGGEKSVYQAFEPILKAIAAKDFAGGATVGYMGAGGAGHYVKMVHNGIEYGDMQMLSEAYLLLKDVGGLTNDELSDVFKKWNQGRMASFLVELLIDIFKKKDDQNKEGYLLDKIMDSAGQKGTGRWTAIEALELGVPLGAVMEAVNMRNLSAFKDLRVRLSKMADKQSLNIKIDKKELIASVEAALYGAKISAYAQGFALLKTADEEFGFGLDLVEISRIWQGGCIIRAELLKLFKDVWAGNVKEEHLFGFEAVQVELLSTIDQWKHVVALGAQTGLPVPGLASALNYFYGITRARSSADLIQAMRDYFGAHTYKRVDMEGSYHSNWAE